VLPMYFLGGVQIFCIGIIGEYLGKTYQEVKARPRFLIEKMARMAHAIEPPKAALDISALGTLSTVGARVEA
jgi:hypothetical protein